LDSECEATAPTDRLQFNSGMSRRALVPGLAVATAAVLSACGQGSAPGTPSASGLPLASGSRILASARRCDGGAHPFCALDLVVAAPAGRYRSSGALMSAESDRLRSAGWSQTAGDTIHETAAESPGHRLRVTYAQAGEDLLSIEQSRIHRAVPIARTLSRELFARAPALSLMLQAGSS
jgi:hypothetical protein